MPSRDDHPAPSRPLAADEADGLAELMTAFATASRLRILFALLGVERTVDEVASTAGLAPSVVSQQLRVLRLFRLVVGRRDGRHVRYRLHDDHVADLLAAIRHHGEHVTDAAGAAAGRAGEGGAPG